MNLMSHTGDNTLTPNTIAQDMIDFFQPTGRILDPCRGEGAFYSLLPPGSDWCEIDKGRDFFDYHEPVDWIIGNPPYSQYAKFLYHALDIAQNVVYLAPAAKSFYSVKMMRRFREGGHIKHMRIYGPGKKGPLRTFAIGFIIAATHYQRGHQGGITFSYWPGWT